MSQAILLVWHNESMDGSERTAGIDGNVAHSGILDVRAPRRQVLRTVYCVNPPMLGNNPIPGPPSLGGNKGNRATGAAGGAKEGKTLIQTARRAQTGRAQPESPNNSTVAFIRANQSPQSAHGKLAASQQPAWAAGKKGGCCCENCNWNWARLTLPHLVDPKGAGTPNAGGFLAWHSL